jgi:hypothetical protein
VHVNVVDHFSRRGYRFAGTAAITGDRTICDALRGEYPPDEAAAYVFEEAVLIRVTSVADLVSPSYFTGRTEQQIRAEYEDSAARPRCATPRRWACGPSRSARCARSPPRPSTARWTAATARRARTGWTARAATAAAR